MIGGVKGRKELPWYVYDKNIFTNEVYVCQGVNNELLMNSALIVNEINWINKKTFNFPLQCAVQVRHQHEPVKCTITIEDKAFKVIFNDKIRAIAPGQSAVFYDNDICLGGGIITKAY
jgi:tRNA-specific 2-thiouridylase